MTHRDRLLKYLRDDLADLSQNQLQRAAHVDKHYISGAEHHGDHLYAPQAERLCETLGWMGDPADLWKFADEVDDVEGKIDRGRLDALRELGASGKLGRRKRRRNRGGDAAGTSSAAAMAAEGVA